MAIVTTVIGKNNAKATIKFVGDASTDTTTFALSTAITIAATGNVTFSAANKTIVRASGSWITDGVVVGAVLTIAGTTSNNGIFIVKSVDSATQITIESNTSVARNFLVDEVDTNGVTWTNSYKSDLLAYGQIISGTPTVNIARCRFSTNSTNDISVSRNSIKVLKLFGTGELDTPTPEQNTQSITVLFSGSGTGGGTLMLELNKIAGFSAVNPAGLI